MTENKTDDVWMTREEAAEYACTTGRTLATLAYKGQGPKYYKPTIHKVLYRRSDLDAWIMGEDAEQ